MAKSGPNKAKKSDARSKTKRRAAAEVPAKTELPVKAAAGAKASEAQIAVHWKEEEYVAPPRSFVAQANLIDPAFVESFREENFPECFRQYADLLDWQHYWHTTLDTSWDPLESTCRHASLSIL